MLLATITYFFPKYLLYTQSFSLLQVHSAVSLLLLIFPLLPFKKLFLYQYSLFSKDSLPGFSSRLIFGFPDFITKNIADLKHLDHKGLQDGLDLLVRVSYKFLQNIEARGNQMAQTGNPPQNKEKLLARRARLLGIIAAKKRDFLPLATNHKSADENDKQAIADYEELKKVVEGKSNDVRLHEQHIGRLSSQVLELKREALVFAQGGEARFASSLITGELTLLRLKQEIVQLQSMKEDVRPDQVKLAELQRRSEQAKHGLEEARKYRDISIQVLRGLSAQLAQDEGWLSGLGWRKEDEEEGED